MDSIKLPIKKKKPIKRYPIEKKLINPQDSSTNMNKNLDKLSISLPNTPLLTNTTIPNSINISPITAHLSVLILV